jgi:hypothetical protein
VTAEFGASQVVLAERLARIRAHHLVAAELLVAGRGRDALLQVSRPITQILPTLESELRGRGDAVAVLTSALGGCGAAVRSGSARRARKVFVAARKATNHALELGVGSVCSSPRFKASVAAAVLGRVEDSYRSAWAAGDLPGYEDCFGLARVAGEICADFGAEIPYVVALLAVFPDVVPPPSPVAPDVVSELIRGAHADLARDYGAVTLLEPTAEDAIAALSARLDDVRAAYRQGARPLAARLAASLFLQAFEPARPTLAGAAPEATEELAAVLGVELRVGINAGLEIDEIAERANSLMHAVMESAQSVS